MDAHRDRSVSHLQHPPAGFVRSAGWGDCVMTAQHLADITLETWRASGPRTESRRALLLTFYAQSYFGPALKWTDDVRALVDAAMLSMRQRTRIDELVYE